MINLLLILIISVYLLPSTLFGQNLAQNSLSDTSAIGLKYRPAFMLPEFKPVFELNYNKDLTRDLNQFQWLTPLKSDSPFQLDVRSSSYYVPRIVRDELNLIMNRPRESAFVPVFGVAILVYQLAQKYLFIKSKTTITSMDLLAAEKYINILRELWEKSPQSVTKIYENLPGLNPTIVHLESQLEVLQDSKLIRTRQTESQTLYFPAISKEMFKAKLIAAMSDSTLNNAQTKILENLLSEINLD